jgi:acyl-CoA synthetase (AMP-forming)/AMP-acid ligase II
MIYWHVGRKNVCIYSQLKSCSSSEVAAMIEGLLRHCTDAEIESNVRRELAQRLHPADSDIVLRLGASVTADELQRFVKDRVAAHKYPRHVWLVDALPMGPSGGRSRRQPADRRAEGRLRAVSRRPRSTHRAEELNGRESGQDWCRI